MDEKLFGVARCERDGGFSVRCGSPCAAECLAIVGWTKDLVILTQLPVYGAHKKPAAATGCSACVNATSEAAVSAMPAAQRHPRVLRCGRSRLATTPALSNAGKVPAPNANITDAPSKIGRAHV